MNDFKKLVKNKFLLKKEIHSKMHSDLGDDIDEEDYLKFKENFLKQKRQPD